MEEIKIDVSLRKEIGSSAVKDLREKGLIPGVVYGKEFSPQVITLSLSEFSRVMRQFGEEAIIFKVTIKDGDVKKDECYAVIQDMQFDAVSDELIHIDFKQVTSRLDAVREAEPSFEHAAEVTQPMTMDDLPEETAEAVEGGEAAEGGESTEEQESDQDAKQEGDQSGDDKADDKEESSEDKKEEAKA